MDDTELARVRRIVHGLVCRDGMTPEQAAGALLSYMIQRSAEAIGQDLQLASCESCASRGPDPQQAEPEPVRPVVHRAVQAGWLSGMVPRG